MAKNKAFLKVLKGISSLPGWSEEEDRLQVEQACADALDALLAADPNDPVAFREAVSEHVVFWNGFEELKETVYHDALDDFVEDDEDVSIPLTKERIKAENEEDAFLRVGHEITLAILHQEAAEQRVKLGLKNAPEDVLINILSNNPDECRAYLATRSSLLNPRNVAGWKADEVIPGALPQTPKKNTSTNVLSDKAIKNIQNEAVFLLLDKLIVECTELDKLDALYEAISEGSQREIEDAIKDINFPQGIIASRSLHSASELIYNEGENSIFIQSLEQRLNQLNQEIAHQNFAQYVADLTPEELLNQKDRLEQDNDDFIDKLPGQFRHLDPDEANINWAKGLLGARFLQAYLPAHQNSVELLALVNTADPQALIDQVKGIATVGDHDYVDEAITDDTVSSIKTAMVQGIISTISGTTQKETDALTALANAKTFAQFNAALPGLDITQVNWLKHDAEMLSMQQSARSRLFEIALSSKSQLGAGANPKLIEAFKSIPPEKQNAVLKQSEQLHHLLNAQNAETVTHYLGKEISDELVGAVLAENKTNSLYRDIPNAAAANILANLNLNPRLTSEKIKDISNAIIGTNLVDNFNEPDKYKNFVDSIKVHCSGVTDAAFYDAFGLTADGTAFTVPTSKDQVKAQQDNNRALLIAFRRSITSVNDKELFKFF